jgi:DNA-binding LacI/PurR family transcriptional regulator
VSDEPKRDDDLMVDGDLEQWTSAEALSSWQAPRWSTPHQALDAAQARCNRDHIGLSWTLHFADGRVDGEMATRSPNRLRHRASFHLKPGATPDAIFAAIDRMAVHLVALAADERLREMPTTGVH